MFQIENHFFPISPIKLVKNRFSADNFGINWPLFAYLVRKGYKKCGSASKFEFRPNRVYTKPKKRRLRWDPTPKPSLKTRVVASSIVDRNLTMKPNNDWCWNPTTIDADRSRRFFKRRRHVVDLQPMLLLLLIDCCWCVCCCCFAYSFSPKADAFTEAIPDADNEVFFQHPQLLLPAIVAHLLLPSFFNLFNSFKGSISWTPSTSVTTGFSPFGTIWKKVKLEGFDKES